MKKMMIASLCLLGSLQVASATTLTFATEATYPPFVSMKANNTMTGFGPDLVHKVCQILKTKCQLVNAPWDSLIPSLKLGKFDVLFGGMGITPARAKVVDFSTPYYQNGASFVTSKKNHMTLTNKWFKGKVVAVQGGTTFQQYLQTIYGKSITIKTYASNMTALMDLTSGRVDAVFLDKPVAVTWLKKSDNSSFTTVGNIESIKYFGPGNAFAINKGNTALLKKIDAALKTLKSNGQLKQLQIKWFGK